MTQGTRGLSSGIPSNATPRFTPSQQMRARPLLCPSQLPHYLLCERISLSFFLCRILCLCNCEEVLTTVLNNSNWSTTHTCSSCCLHSGLCQNELSNENISIIVYWIQYFNAPWSHFVDWKRHVPYDCAPSIIYFCCNPWILFIHKILPFIISIIGAFFLFQALFLKSIIFFHSHFRSSFPLFFHPRLIQSPYSVSGVELSAVHLTSIPS